MEVKQQEMEEEKKQEAGDNEVIAKKFSQEESKSGSGPNMIGTSGRMNKSGKNRIIDLLRRTTTKRSLT